MDRFLSKILNTVIAIGIVLIVLQKDVYAGITNNVSSTYVEDYSVVTDFHEEMNGQGEYNFPVTLDLSEIDELYIPHCMIVEKCCGNQIIPKTNHITVKINDRVVYNNEYLKPVDSLFQMDYVDKENATVNIKRFTSSHAKVEYDIECMTQTCQNCGAFPAVQFKIGGFKFYDLRATASNVPSEINVLDSGSGTLGYTFSNNTSRVVWAIRYKNETGFTPLIEGTNRDGLVAKGVNSKVLSISSVPKSMDGCEIGAFTYDEDGKLPAGTAYPNTPFYTKINVMNNSAPSVEIKKTIDPGSKSVIIEIIATDDVGLHATPYSYDGGVTYEASNKKGFKSPGEIKVAVRDASGNITTKEIYIDAIEIEKANPSIVDGGGTIKDKETSSGKGESSSGSGTTGQNGGSTQNGGNANSNGVTIGDNENSGTFENIKKGDSEHISESTSVKDTLKPIGETKQILSGGNSTTKDKSTSKNTSLKAKEISDKDSKDVFDRIRKNSEDYIISMRETKKEEPKGAKKDEATIDLKEINDDEKAEAYSNSANDEENMYSPKKQKDSPIVFVAVTIGMLALFVILAIVLFFGVIVFEKKETEYTALSGSDGMKVPVALLFVSYKDGGYSLCFRELLNKYDVLYVRFGALFSHIYENEKISIMTRFKGEKKREIAKEAISREIVIGKIGGKKK